MYVRAILFLCVCWCWCCCLGCVCYVLFHCTLKTVERFMIFRKRDAYTITQENGHTDARSHACIVAAATTTTTTTKKGRRIVVDNENSVINFSRWLATFVSDNNFKCPRHFARFHFGGQIHIRNKHMHEKCRCKTILFDSIENRFGRVFPSSTVATVSRFIYCVEQWCVNEVAANLSSTLWKIYVKCHLHRLPLAAPHKTVRNRVVCARELWILRNHQYAKLTKCSQCIETCLAILCGQSHHVDLYG